MNETPKESVPVKAWRHETLTEAVLAVMREVAYVQKEQSPGLRYSFASESEMIAVLRPAMVRHGVIGPVPIRSTVVHRETFGEKKMGMHVIIVREFRFLHAHSQDTIEVETLGEAMDAGDKAIPKAMTLAKKYALREIFLLETGDDPDYIQRQEAEDTAGIFPRFKQALYSTAAAKRPLEPIMEKVKASPSMTEEQKAALTRLYQDLVTEQRSK